MLARVSHVETYRRWLLDESASVDDLVKQITTDDPTPEMRVGTALHKALELAGDGEHETLTANGYTFHLPDAELDIPEIRELRGYKQYGDLTITGRVDAIHGKRIDDHKTTARFDAERYLSGIQWRLYLEIFDCDVFRWNVFEIREAGPLPLVYRVSPPQLLVEYRYPGMADDIERVVSGFAEFAAKYLPEENW